MLYKPMDCSSDIHSLYVILAVKIIQTDIMKFVIFIYCVGLGVVVSDKKVDLKSILLQILNQEKTNSQSNTLSGINVANVNNAESKTAVNTAGLNANTASSTLEVDGDQNGIIKEATKEIFDEINRLKAKYVKNGNKVQDIAGDDNGIAKLKESGSANGVGFKHSGDNQDEDYDILVMKLNSAAEELLLLRSKLSADHMMTDEDFQMFAEEDGIRPKTPEKWSKVNRLIEILLGFESDMQNDKNENEGLARLGQAERDWHVKGCSEFKDPCLGWFPDCCKSGQIGKTKFNMCCSFSHYNLKGKDKLSGICIPNAYGSGRCVQRKP